MVRPQRLHLIFRLGVLFLFRVGLAIFSCCRRTLLQSSSPEAVLDSLFRPPTTALPASPDALIELAFTMKLKDDDIRKQRIKMEAQVKRQTQIRPPTATTGKISLPRS